MNVYFDVDYTILSVDYDLRPGTLEVFQRLVADGHKVHVWSGEGERHKVVDDHGLRPYVTGVFSKPLVDHGVNIREYARGLKRFKVDPVPDFVIDDYPGIVGYFGGYYIKEFYRSGHDDGRELQAVYDAITQVAATGASTERRWKPRNPDADAQITEVFSSRFL